MEYAKNKKDNDECIVHYLSQESSLQKTYRDTLANQLKDFLRDCNYHKEGRTEHNLFSFLADAVPNGIVITNANREIEWVNRAYTEMTGYTFEESVGVKPGKLLQGVRIDREKVERMTHSLNKKTTFSEELLNYRKDGEPFWIRITITPVVDEHNELQHYIGIQEDITDRKRAQQQAVQNSKVLEAISNQSSFAVFLKDEQGRYRFVNPMWEKWFGMEKEKVIGKTVFDLFDEETAAMLYKQDRTVINDNENVFQDEIIQNGKGPKYYAISKFPVRNIPEIEKGIAGIATDVTKLKLSEEKVRRSEERLNLAESIANVGCWEMDMENEALIWSDEIYRIFELDPDEFDPSYEAFLELVHPEDRQKVRQVYEESMKNKTSYHLTHRLKFSDGRIKYVEEYGDHSYDDQGKVIRTLGTVQDITKRELRQQKIKESLKEKQVLLSEIHHRVKNNLALVSGMLQLQMFNEENTETANKLQDSVNRIKTIAVIHEQLYQTEQFANVDLSQNLKRLASYLLSVMQHETEITLDFRVCAEVKLNMTQILPVSLIANEVITNVIKHAFKGRYNGTIEISIVEEEGQVEMQIRDNGIGLPSDFESRENDSLGMDLIKTLVRQLEGTSSYSSSENGTTFTLQFAKDQ